MTRPIHVLNGPNLNRLGKREPEIYGSTTLAEVEAMCRDAAGGHPLVFRQSNYEGEIVGWIHEAIDADAGIVINPAGLTFTSIPILDALKMSPGPIVELHISNIHRREAIYHAPWSRRSPPPSSPASAPAATRSRCGRSATCSPPPPDAGVNLRPACTVHAYVPCMRCA